MISPGFSLPVVIHRRLPLIHSAASHNTIRVTVILLSLITGAVRTLYYIFVLSHLSCSNVRLLPCLTSIGINNNTIVMFCQHRCRFSDNDYRTYESLSQLMCCQSVNVIHAAATHYCNMTDDYDALPASCYCHWRDLWTYYATVLTV